MKLFQIQTNKYKLFYKHKPKQQNFNLIAMKTLNILIQF